MRLKIPQQTQLSSLCLSNRRPSSVRRPAPSSINPFPLPSPFQWGYGMPGRRQARRSGTGTVLARDLRPSPSSSSPGECFAKREQNATAPVCIGPKITPGGFAGDVVSASPTRSHPAVLFLLPVSLATPPLAWAGEPGGRQLPAGPAAAAGEAISAAHRAGGSRRRGPMSVRNRLLCVRL